MAAFKPKFEVKVRLHGKVESIVKRKQTWEMYGKECESNFLEIGFVGDSGDHFYVIDKDVYRIREYLSKNATGTINLAVGFGEYFNAGCCTARILVESFERDDASTGDTNKEVPV